MRQDKWIEEVEAVPFDYEAEPEISSNCTYGIEIEFVGVHKDDVGKMLNESMSLERIWETKEEMDVRTREGHGGEVTSPIMVGNFTDWIEIKNVCGDITYIGGKTDHTCGGHIHYGSQMLKDNHNNYHNLILLWAAFEDVIKIFCAGESEEIREGIHRHAPLIGQRISKNFERATRIRTIGDLLDFYNLDHPVDRHALNFSKLINRPKREIDGTIEVRLPNGTLNPVIWQNNILFFDALINKATNLSKEELNIIKKRLKSTYPGGFNEFKLLLDMISTDELLKLKWQKQFLLSGWDLTPDYQDFHIALAGISRNRV